MPPQALKSLTGEDNLVVCGGLGWSVTCKQHNLIVYSQWQDEEECQFLVVPQSAVFISCVLLDRPLQVVCPAVQILWPKWLKLPWDHWDQQRYISISGEHCVRLKCGQNRGFLWNSFRFHFQPEPFIWIDLWFPRSENTHHAKQDIHSMCSSHWSFGSLNSYIFTGVAIKISFFAQIAGRFMKSWSLVWTMHFISFITDEKICCMSAKNNLSDMCQPSHKVATKAEKKQGGKFSHCFIFFFQMRVYTGRMRLSWGHWQESGNWTPSGMMSRSGSCPRPLHPYPSATATTTNPRDLASSATVLLKT